MNENNSNTKVKDVIQIDSELLNNISVLIENQASSSILNIITDLHPADIAEIINHLKVDDARFVFELLETETAGEVIVELDENLREKILKEIDKEKITDIVDELETDDATDILSDLPENVAEHVLDNIDIEDSVEVKELLKYREDSAGGIMSSDYVYVLDTASVGKAIETVRFHSEEYEDIYYIYVLNNDDVLRGRVALKSLIVNTPETRISSVMEEDLIVVTPDTDQEEVANLMKKYDLISIPVVDDNKKMLGRITFDDIADVIQEEADEDIQIFAGLSEEQESSDSVFRISRIRLPWLLVGLVGELLNVVLLKSFGATIEQIATSAYFFPLVMAMGGSSGTQASIVMVKSLSSGNIWMKQAFERLGKEFLVSLLNGIVISGLLLVINLLLFDKSYFIVILSVSLLCIIVFATVVGASIPLALKRFNVDPAVATGPFVTTMNDIFGLFIYMTFLTIFLIS
ncbi:MAG: magnesium transporter [Melioribacteraceae bacterium]|nr:magnesium transporter [Melioribacteraceae bacterium]